MTCYDGSKIIPDCSDNIILFLDKEINILDIIFYFSIMGSIAIAIKIVSLISVYAC